MINRLPLLQADAVRCHAANIERNHLNQSGWKETSREDRGI